VRAAPLCLSGQTRNERSERVRGHKMYKRRAARVATVSTLASAALILGWAGEGASNLETPSRRSWNSLSGFAAVLGRRLQAGLRDASS
jgi:hypothetical protein